MRGLAEVSVAESCKPVVWSNAKMFTLVIKVIDTGKARKRRIWDQEKSGSNE